ncbi:hypothetical protein SCP_0503490 [Sparassis crispa]|uniref:Transmembrane protein n=1 Tax=Sparassis crispa TaxID=139825 RepID=A0A401GM50_9APHY|nr:hypothetical protein SCP_0503490 [Sparassis crispa]GBE83301.1 hypothetical protein SCP_0503490 [Sparassis crispa]
MAQTSVLPFQSASGGYSSLPVTGESTPPQSRTMMYAVIAPATPSTALTKPADTAVRLRSAAALNSTEQYWAARALTAEAALSVRAAFHQEVYVLTESHEEKRAHELAELQRIHDERHAKLERLVLILLGCLFAFVSAILYILFRQHTDYRSSRWCLPSHFTIPVLSPFTSVVEHETSVFNTRSITIVLLVLAALAYACFRYWLSHLRHR